VKFFACVVVVFVAQSVFASVPFICEVDAARRHQAVPVGLIRGECVDLGRVARFCYEADGTEISLVSKVVVPTQNGRVAVESTSTASADQTVTLLFRKETTDFVGVLSATQVSISKVSCRRAVTQSPMQ
jgi:hypothetical protein